MKIIPYDKNYEFCFLERGLLDTGDKHPVDNYYLKLDDLSINLLITLKWIEWGYVFFKELSDNLDNIKDDFKIEYILNKSIGVIEIKKEDKKILIIDDIEIKDYDDFKKKMKEFYIDFPLIEKNDKVHIKLKMNIREFLIISQILKPTFWKKN